MARRQPDTVANPARGVALVVAAVLVGLFLLRNGLDSSSTRTETGADQGTDLGTDDAANGGTDDGATTTTLPARPPAEVKVIVLNNSGVTGAAGRYSTAIGAAGFGLENDKGADSSLEGDSAATQVLYQAGYDVDAAAVATAIGAPATSVAPIGTQSPGPVGAANVIVVLGTDIANETPGA